MGDWARGYGTPNKIKNLTDLIQTCCPFVQKSTHTDRLLKLVKKWNRKIFPYILMNEAFINISSRLMTTCL